MAAEQVLTRRRRFSVSVLLPIVLVLAATLVLVAGVVRWAADGSDTMAKERQTRLVERAVTKGIEDITREQESVTIWDESIHNLRKLDPDWLDGNLGVWLYDYFGIDRVFVLGADDKPLYAMMGGRRADVGYWNAHRSAVEPIVHRLRAQILAAAVAGEAMPSEHEVAVVENRPAVIGVSPIVSDTGRIVQAPGTEFLHVAIRFLDTGFLTTVTQNSLVDSARFSWTGTVGAHEGRFAVRGSNGEPVGWVAWTADTPGARLTAQTAPYLAGAALVMILVVWLMARRLYRTSSELEASEAQAQHLAFHDALTGLPNRALFANRLEHALARVRRGEERIALLYMDLDRFKYVNDTFGHPAGDELIREFSGRLQKILRSCDTVARLGGDEFAVIQTGVSGEAATVALCRRILEAVAEPFAVVGQEAFVGVTIGVAVAPDAASDASELVRKADIALYRAKSEGRNCYRIFAQAMDESVQRRQVIESELRKALDSDQLELHYQPLFSADGLTVAGVEALVRWHHPEHGLLSPAAFIPIAEECGLIVPLGEWVLRNACKAGTRLHDLTVAVNVSAIQLRAAGFADMVRAVVTETGIDPRRLELEITESALLDDQPRAVATIRALHEIGVKVALDDFGTGYSSLSYLRAFAVDKIKIDRSFVKNLADEAGAETIVEAIVSLGRAMGMQVTAEGVETADQLKFLAKTGCHQVQGFLLSRPLPLDELEAVTTRVVKRARQRGTVEMRRDVA
jgi:diguanylate cyclase (GGDEF)-like protein